MCSEEEVKHTIRHRWLSLPGNVLILSRGRSVPFLFCFVLFCLANAFNLGAPSYPSDLYLFDRVFLRGSSVGQLIVIHTVGDFSGSALRDMTGNSFMKQGFVSLLHRMDKKDVE